MKKQQILFAFAALLTISGCKKENFVEGDPITFDVSIEQSMTKVHLVEDNYKLKPCWDQDDEIHINNGTGSVTPLENTTRGTFTTTNLTSNPQGKYFAIYPASMVPSTSDISNSQQQSVVLPRVQTYRADQSGIQIVDAPMFAYNPGPANGGSRNLEFHNLCGLMQIVITNDKAWDMILDSVHVEASSRDLWGSNFTIQGPETTQPYLESGDNTRNNNFVSLAGAGSSSIGTFVKSSVINNDATACTVYVYLPKITATSNKFTIRIFSHPVWNGTADPQVHIVYSKTQGSQANGSVNRSELVKVPVSLASCGPTGTTFTSMKPFSTGSGANDKVCLSRGYAQYNIATGAWRFSPRQWAFLAYNDTPTYHLSENYTLPSNYTWVEYFGWATGDNPQRGQLAASMASGYRSGNTITSQGANRDWGNNFQNVPGVSWKTLSQPEWDYIFTGRNTSIANPSFGWAELTGTGDNPWQNIYDNYTGKLYGVILVPDNVNLTSITNEAGYRALDLPSTGFNGSNTIVNQTVTGMKRNANKYTQEQFEYLEAHGCIFLPCIGHIRLETIVLSTYYVFENKWGGEGTADPPDVRIWTSYFAYGNGSNLADAALSLFLDAKDGSVDVIMKMLQPDLCDLLNCVRLACPATSVYKWDPDQI